MIFEEGKKCSSVSNAPVGFSLDHEQCYVTSWIPFWGTSSLRFMEKGTFAYAIEVTGGELGEKGKDLNEDIGNLVKKGLPERIQKALDTVRVVGNNAVHPGQIVIEDNPKIALSLFKLVNLIVEHMITMPKEVEQVYNTLPQGAKDQIKKRDKARPSP